MMANKEVYAMSNDELLLFAIIILMLVLIYCLYQIALKIDTMILRLEIIDNNSKRARMRRKRPQNSIKDEKWESRNTTGTESQEK